MGAFGIIVPFTEQSPKATLNGGKKSLIVIGNASSKGRTIE